MVAAVLVNKRELDPWEVKLFEISFNTKLHNSGFLIKDSITEAISNLKSS